MSMWNDVLSRGEIAAYFDLTASIDPRFAREERAFYASRTLDQLRVLMAEAWDCCDATAYQLARSYLGARS